jgi:uncharacterized membrane protein YphA (DoxX/SURF4 family)
MLNPFPIQFLALLAYFILRVITGLVLITLGFRHLKHRETLAQNMKLTIAPFGGFNVWALAITEIAVGSLLIIGLHTQWAALILIIMSLKLIWLERYFKHSTIPSRLFYLLLIGIGLSLFITGAGAFAFDLPI